MTLAAALLALFLAQSEGSPLPPGTGAPAAPERPLAADAPAPERAEPAVRSDVSTEPAAPAAAVPARSRASPAPSPAGPRSAADGVTVEAPARPEERPAASASPAASDAPSASPAPGDRPAPSPPPGGGSGSARPASPVTSPPRPTSPEAAPARSVSGSPLPPVQAPAAGPSVPAPAASAGIPSGLRAAPPAAAPPASPPVQAAKGPPSPERVQVAAVARRFVEAFAAGRAAEVAAACAPIFSFDGRVEKGADAVRARWAEILPDRGSVPVLDLAVAPAAEAQVRLGRPPRRLAPLLGPGTWVAVADVAGRALVVVWARQGGGWAATGVHAGGPR